MRNSLFEHGLKRNLRRCSEKEPEIPGYEGNGMVPIIAPRAQLNKTAPSMGKEPSFTLPQASLQDETAVVVHRIQRQEKEGEGTRAGLGWIDHANTSTASLNSPAAAVSPM